MSPQRHRTPEEERERIRQGAVRMEALDGAIRSGEGDAPRKPVDRTLTPIQYAIAAVYGQDPALVRLELPRSPGPRGRAPVPQPSPTVAPAATPKVKEPAVPKYNREAEAENRQLVNAVILCELQERAQAIRDNTRMFEPGRKREAVLLEEADEHIAMRRRTRLDAQERRRSW